MSEDKKHDDLGGLDWDDALDEWEKNTFTGEVAISNAPEPLDSLGNSATEEVPAPIVFTELPAPQSDIEGTLIARAPQSTDSRPPPGKSKGGLGQLFARKSSIPAPLAPPRKASSPPAPEDPFAPPSEAASSGGRVHSPDDETEVFTSASISAKLQSYQATSNSPEAPPFPELRVTGESAPLEEGETVSQRGETHAADDEGPTGWFQRTSSAPPPPAPPPAAVARARGQDDSVTMRIDPPTVPHQPAAAPQMRESVVDEREIQEEEEEFVVPDGMDAELAKSLRDSARWLSEEAGQHEDPGERVRVQLAASEVWAILGDELRARNAAEEAHASAPRHALAAKQRRQTGPRDDDFRIACLREEADSAETPTARATAALLVADMARVLGDGDTAVEALRSACSYDPADIRAPLALAALSLAHNDHTSPFLSLEVTELAELADAIERALELREVDRKARAPEHEAPNHRFFRAKTAFEKKSRDGVMDALAELREVPELTNAITWLSASIGATDTPTRKRAATALTSLAQSGDLRARAALAMRGAELFDPDIVARAVKDDGALAVDDRLSMIALGLLDATNSESFEPTEKRALDAAIAGAVVRKPEFSGAVAGTSHAHSPIRLARSLIRRAPDVDAALEAARGDSAAKAVSLEFAMRAGKLTDVAETLVDWAHQGSRGGLGPTLVAGLLAERAGDKERAAVAYKSARAFASGSDGLVRIAGATDDTFDVAFALDAASEHAKSPFSSGIMRLEAATLTRATNQDPTELWTRAHQADAELGIASFLLYRGARSRGDIDDVLYWLGERVKTSTDTLEVAIELVREALLLADRDTEQSREKLESAHASRPDDFALRELLERLSPQSAASCADWRAKHAVNAVGPARATRFVEAALLAEAASPQDARRYAREAASSGDVLARALLEHCEVASGEISRLVEHLLLEARTGTDDVIRREAYERLADVEVRAKREGATPEAWHKAILQATPDHLPSLRALEHIYLGGDSDAELEPVAERLAMLLGGTAGGECAGHALLSNRLKLRGGVTDWEGTRALVDLAAQQKEPPTWALRAKNAHARFGKNSAAIVETAVALAERTTREGEVAALMRRASEAALELNREKAAREYLERAASEDAGDAVTWGLLADARERAQDTRGSAEACESLARTSNVESHRILAWYDAAKLWLDVVHEQERGILALEQAANLDVAYEDVFARLSRLYTAKGNDAELAALLARRLERATDPDERVTLEVDRARALAEIGDFDAALEALRKALEARPDHTTALSAYADLSEKLKNYTEAEQAWVRLSRLLSTPDEQRVIYERLGVLYSQFAVNLPRAEVALKEVLKRAPGHVPTLERLVDVYRQKNDAPHATEAMQELVSLSEDEQTRLTRLIALAEIHETVGRELRKAEQVLEGARKEFPTSVVALRAMAEFYSRQKQIPAMHILLDRAAGDARRAFASGRLVTSLFQILAAAYELRGKKDAANVVQATLAALEGNPAKIRGAEMRAFDPRLDDLLAPEILSPALRALLAAAGDALDLALPVDLRTLRANSLPTSSPVHSMANAIASAMGISGLNVLVSSQLTKTCIPCGSNPPMIIVGEALVNAQNDRAKAFLLSRSLKTVKSKSSALVRAQPQDLSMLLIGWLAAFNPGWAPPGVNQKALAEALKRIAPVMPRNNDPQLGALALEIAGTLAGQTSIIGPAALSWSNRCALLAIGDPTAAVEAIAWTTGLDRPPQGEERAAWVARTPEARDLLVLSVSDAYSEARARLGIDR